MAKPKNVEAENEVASGEIPGELLVELADDSSLLADETPIPAVIEENGHEAVDAPAVIEEHAPEQPLEALKERIGVFILPWKIVTRYSPHSTSVHVTSFNAGEIVWDESLIESLLAQNAPIKVYSRDAD